MIQIQRTASSLDTSFNNHLRFVDGVRPIEAAYPPGVQLPSNHRSPDTSKADEFEQGRKPVTRGPAHYRQRVLRLGSPPMHPIKTSSSRKRVPPGAEGTLQNDASSVPSPAASTVRDVHISTYVSSIHIANDAEAKGLY